MHSIILSAVVTHRDYSIVRPLGPYRLASYLRENGYDIQVIEFIHILEDDEIYKLVRKFITSETKFIGFSLMIDYRHPKLMQHVTKITNLFLNLKKDFPQLKFLMGGSTGFLWSRRFPHAKVFDYIIKGYGEDQTLALFDYYYKGGPHPPFEIVDGNKHISEHLFVDKKFDFTYSRHKWHKHDCIQPNEALPIEFARGCIFKCAFCRYPHIGKNKNDYTKHIECIRDELIDNYQNYKTDTYYVADDTMNADVEFIRAFTDMSKSLPFKLKYGGFLRLDLIHAHPETEDMYLENGLTSVYFGIESFQEDNAKMIGKAWSAKHGKDYLPYIYHDKWKKNIHMSVGLIAGLPHETLPDLKEVNNWFISNNFPTWLWHPLFIGRNGNYYKSEFDVNAEKYGFDFKVVEGKSIWTNKVCDEELAKDWTDELQNDVKIYTGPNTWLLLELTTYGMDINDTSKLKSKDIPWMRVTESGKQFLRNYVADLKAI